MAARVRVQIEYCAEWGYEGHAARVAAEILADHGGRISGLTIVPSSGGRFVVQIGDKEIFNKKDAGRFPQEGEATRLVGQAL